MNLRTSLNCGLCLGFLSQICCVISNLLMVIILFMVSPEAVADPDCAGIDRWPTRSALVTLKNANLIGDGVVFPKTKTIRLASERLSNGKYRQIHLVTFVKKSGSKIEVITSNLVSKEECSVSGLQVFVISSRYDE